jgi:CsoR family transcriptional regulator, copper-sensing transcriptional repressor
MKLENQESKEKLIQRLRRIEGQVRGVQTMLEEERDCREILQQLTAVRSAVNGASRFFLEAYATACLLDIEDPDQDRGKREKVIHEMITFMDKAQ